MSTTPCATAIRSFHWKPGAQLEFARELIDTALMEALEARFEGVKVFSLPSVDHPQRGRHIELGVKGEPEIVARAYDALVAGLQAIPGVRFGTE